MILRAPSGGLIINIQVIENEGDHHIHAITLYPAILNHDLLFLDPSALDISKRRGSLGNATLDGVLETGVGCRRQFNDLGYRHLLDPSLGRGALTLSLWPHPIIEASAAGLAISRR